MAKSEYRLIVYVCEEWTEKVIYRPKKFEKKKQFNMAKFSACYQLCPLIDQKNFLGVTDESINGCVIITLGKNMVIRHKLSDQKQVSSWSSTEKLSAPVVYDVVNQVYIGVFKASQISTWEESCVKLSDVKKFKFASEIECVLTSPASVSPVVVFRSGHVLPLQQALDRRKTPPPTPSPLKPDERISDAHLITLIGSVVVALFTTATQEVHRLHLIPLDEGPLMRSCLQLNRKAEEEVKLISHALLTYESCQLLTLWSDGQLFKLELPTPDSQLFPGEALTTLTSISVLHPAAILPLSPTHLAIYGADASEEGALLFIFNSQLKMTQCQQFFKLYTPPARLWAGGKGSILVAAGQFLAVVPFHLGKNRLAALVGMQESDSPTITHADWGSSAATVKEEEYTESNVQKTIRSLMEEGISQGSVCQNLMLPLLDCRDVNGLLKLLDNISDIPESCIVSALKLCLKNLKEPGFKELLLRLLTLPVTPDLTTLRLLRQELGLSSVLRLLRALTDAMREAPGEPQLIEWATLLLDAHYQQYLLSKDKAVIKTLTELKGVVEVQLMEMTDWQQLDALLHQLTRGPALPDSTLPTNSAYSIEQIKLY